MFKGSRRATFRRDNLAIFRYLTECTIRFHPSSS